MMIDFNALTWVLLAIGVRIQQFAHLRCRLALPFTDASTYETGWPAGLSRHLDPVHLDADGPAGNLHLKAPLQFPCHLLCPCQHRPQRPDDLSPVLLINRGKRRLVTPDRLP